MKTLKLTLTSIAIMSMAACQTVPQDVLLAGISADKITPATVSVTEEAAGSSGSFLGGLFGKNDVPGIGNVSAASTLAESQIRASVTNPTCAQFNMNSLAFAATPETPSFGTGILKTIIMGTVAGVASGGVASVGIGSAFVETAVAGTVNQVVFNGTKPIVDKVIPDVSYLGTEKELAIKESAARIGCPNPSWTSTLSPTEAVALLSKLNGEAKAAEKLLKAAKKIGG